MTDRTSGDQSDSPESRKQDDDPDRGQPIPDGEHRPLTREYPRPNSEPYTVEFNPDDDEYPPQDEIWPEQAENTEKYVAAESTDWFEYVQYFCRHCAEECINCLDEERTWTKECRTCFNERSDSTLVRVTHHLPDDVTAGNGERPGAVDEVYAAARRVLEDD